MSPKLVYSIRPASCDETRDVLVYQDKMLILNEVLASDRHHPAKQRLKITKSGYVYHPSKAYLIKRQEYLKRKNHDKSTKNQQI